MNTGFKKAFLGILLLIAVFSAISPAFAEINFFGYDKYDDVGEAFSEGGDAFNMGMASIGYVLGEDGANFVITFALIFIIVKFLLGSISKTIYKDSDAFKTLATPLSVILGISGASYVYFSGINVARFLGPYIFIIAVIFGIIMTILGIFTLTNKGFSGSRKALAIGIILFVAGIFVSGILPLSAPGWLHLIAVLAMFGGFITAAVSLVFVIKGWFGGKKDKDDSNNKRQDEFKEFNKEVKTDSKKVWKISKKGNRYLRNIAKDIQTAYNLSLKDNPDIGKIRDILSSIDFTKIRNLVDREQAGIREIEKTSAENIDKLKEYFSGLEDKDKIKENLIKKINEKFPKVKTKKKLIDADITAKSLKDLINLAEDFKNSDEFKNFVVYENKIKELSNFSNANERRIIELEAGKEQISRDLVEGGISLEEFREKLRSLYENIRIAFRDNRAVMEDSTEINNSFSAFMEEMGKYSTRVANIREDLYSKLIDKFQTNKHPSKQELENLDEFE